MEIGEDPTKLPAFFSRDEVADGRTSEHCSLTMSPYGPIGRIVAFHKVAFYLLSSCLRDELPVTQLRSLISVVLDAELDVVLNVPKPRCA